MLHIIRQSPYQQDISHELATLIANQDDVLLIDDGVYFKQSLHYAIIKERSANVFITKEHSIARGITANTDDAMISIENIASFILQYPSTITWQL